MAQRIPMPRFLQALWGDRGVAASAAEVGRAMGAARSLCRTDEGEGRGGVQANPVDPRPVWRGAAAGGTPPGPGDRIRGGDAGLLALALGGPPSGAGHPLGGWKTIADRGDRRAIETLWPVGDRPVGSSLGFWQDLAGPESGLSGCGVQGGAGSCRTPGNRMDLQRMEVGATFRDLRDLLGLERQPATLVIFRLPRSRGILRPRPGQAGRDGRGSGTPQRGSLGFPPVPTHVRT